MKDLVEVFNAQQKAKFTKKFPNYRPGDTVRVSCKIIEGESSRIQVFEGVVIAHEKGRDNFNAAFTVRKMSHDGIGVERKFMAYSPLVEKIEIIKRGDVRKSKLYYLRNLKGKSARIREKLNIPVKN
jgi:large subunit ribosomal protein L19